MPRFMSEPLPLPLPGRASNVPRLLLLGQPSDADLVDSLAESEQVEFIGKQHTTEEALGHIDGFSPDVVLVNIDDERLRRELGQVIAARPGVLFVGLTGNREAPWVGETVASGLSAVVTLSEAGGGEQLVADVCVLAMKLGAQPDEKSSSGG
jgi:AmiR/NasT family two-component response regulator